jgi:rhomboid-like protein
MALIRPCAGLRPGVPTTHQWSTVTSAFARRFCLSPPSSANSRVSLLSILQSRHCAPSPQQSYAFSTTPRPTAKVHSPGPPPRPYKPPPPKKRTVKIGPLPTGEVDVTTINSIFGTKVSHTDGNNVLRILHHRRTSGSLADYGVDNLGHKYAHVNRTLATKALEWLREAFPVDEGRAAEQWAEKEANRIAYELWLADPENDSKYKDPARVWRDQQKEIELQNEQQEDEGQKIGMLRAGPSQFEKNIADKRRQRLEEAAKKAEEKEAKEREEMVKLETGEWVKTPRGTGLMKPGQTAYVDVFGREQISQRKELQEAYRKKAELQFKTPEEMLAATTIVSLWSSLPPPIQSNQLKPPRRNALSQ